MLLYIPLTFFYFIETIIGTLLSEDITLYYFCVCFSSSDYRPMPALDRYDAGNLDEEDYDAMSQTERMAAEEEMRRRDREMGILRRDDRELFYDMSDEEEVRFKSLNLDI